MKYLIDFTALAFLYAFVFLKKWKSRGRDVLLVNTLMYIYLSFVLYFTLMPIIVELPFILNHPYTPMNMVPFIDVMMERGDFVKQVVLNVVMTMPFGFLFPLTRKKSAGFFNGNDLELINIHFDKKECFKKNFLKWKTAV